MASADCHFCNPTDETAVLRNELCYARWDSYPVNEGHMLIVPWRHVADYFEVSEQERSALWEMVDEVNRFLAEHCQPDGYNVGINIGQSAGQSVFHVHVHVIPRYEGDMADPRGGVRGVIPEKQKY